MELTYYFNRVAETTREYFIDIYPIKGLVISGPGPTKEDFINGNYLEYRLQDMIISTIVFNIAFIFKLVISFYFNNIKVVEFIKCNDKAFSVTKSSNQYHYFSLKYRSLDWQEVGL